MQRDPFEYPKLRWPIEMRLDKVQGQQALVLRCPIGIAERPLVLRPAVIPILNSCNGSASVAEIAGKFAEQGLQEKAVRELVAVLEQHLFLDSPAFTAAEEKARDDFAKVSVRTPVLSGAAYPAEKEKLSAEVDKFLTHASTDASLFRGSLTGLITPHIDYRRGGRAYGRTYAALKNQNHDLYVLLGTAHQYSSRMFHLTLKSFSTPMGEFKCDREFAEKLAQLHGRERSFADEMLHKKEHSLELQLPFLGRLKGTPKIVPILVGGFHADVLAGKLPGENEEYASFAAALATCVREWTNRGKKVCLLAAVDMAHVGRTFGDPGALNQQLMAEVARRDLMFLDLVKAHDTKGLVAHIALDRDSRRVCGFPAVYTFMDVFDRLSIRYEARVLSYDQAIDYQTDCAVTYAGVGVYKV